MYSSESAPTDRCQLELFWGDGESDSLIRVNGPSLVCAFGASDGESLGLGIKKSIYTGTHTYPGPGPYQLTMMDPNRTGGIVNMQDSFNTPFAITSTIYVEGGLTTQNSSIYFPGAPVFTAQLNHEFKVNVGAIDPDGDSLSFAFVDCMEGFEAGTGLGLPSLGYWMPTGMTLDAINGELVWNTPDTIGRHAIAIEVSEWRSGFKISKVVRDYYFTVVNQFATNYTYFYPSPWETDSNGRYAIQLTQVILSNFLSTISILIFLHSIHLGRVSSFLTHLPTP